MQEFVNYILQLFHTDHIFNRITKEVSIILCYSPSSAEQAAKQVCKKYKIYTLLPHRQIRVGNFDNEVATSFFLVNAIQLLSRPKTKPRMKTPGFTIVQADSGKPYG